MDTLDPNDQSMAATTPFGLDEDVELALLTSGHEMLTGFECLTPDLCAPWLVGAAPWRD